MMFNLGVSPRLLDSLIQGFSCSLLCKARLLGPKVSRSLPSPLPITKFAGICTAAPDFCIGSGELNSSI